MKNKNKIAIGLAFIISAGLFAGCNNQASKEQDKKTVLKALIPYQSFDPNTDSSAKRIMDKTGYKVEYSVLPQQNANEKLMMEMASGTEYDLLRLSPVQFGQLANQNTLFPLDDLLDKFGENIKKTGSAQAWKAAKSNDKTFAIPIDSDKNPDNPYGIIMSGVGIRSDILKELNLTLPTDTASLYNTLKTIKSAKNIAPLTGLGGFNPTIGSGFGIPAVDWFVTENNHVIPRIKMPQTKAYLEYMAKLYKEGLIDADWPMNKQETVNQKFTSGKSVMTNMFFWDIPTIINALKQNNSAAEIKFITPLNGPSGKPLITVSKGVEVYEAVPKTSQKAEQVVKYTNLRCDPQIFVSTFIGDKGVHYEIKDDKYYPISPAFDELKNSKQFTGPSIGVEGFKMWQARARKTPEMAKAYDEMNQGITKDMILANSFEYSNSVPEVQKYRMSLKKLEEDFYVKALVSNQPMDKMLDEFIKSWETQGGTIIEKAMNEWYQSNKD